MSSEDSDGPLVHSSSHPSSLSQQEKNVNPGDYSTHAGQFQVPDVFTQASQDVSEGQFERAEHALLFAIRQDQNNLELRLKLLEVYADSNNKASFDRQVEQLQKRGLVVEGDPNWRIVRQLYVDTWVYD